MARISTSALTSKERQELERELLRAVSSLRKEDVLPFLRDLLTPGEILMLGRRIRIARALLAGKTYEAIANSEDVSYSTIQLVDRAIQHGLEGYRQVLKRVRTSPRSHRNIPNETIEALKAIPGMGRYRFWLDLFASTEDK